MNKYDEEKTVMGAVKDRCKEVLRFIILKREKRANGIVNANMQKPLMEKDRLEGMTW